jgi:outer membrane protein TolC
VIVPIPLFDWGQARRAKVEAQRIEARHRLTQTRRQVVEEVRRSIAAFRASEVALAKVRTELIPLADQRREQAEASYKNGFADITAVLLAEQDAQGARAKLIELQKKVSSARFRLQRAAGGPGVLPDAPATTQPTTQTSTEKP